MDFFGYFSNGAFKGEKAGLGFLGLLGITWDYLGFLGISWDFLGFLGIVKSEIPAFSPLSFRSVKDREHSPSTLRGVCGEFS